MLCLVALAALAAPAAALEKPGAPLPGITLPTLDGGEIKLAEATQGKVVVFIYWSLSCPVCREELPQLVQMNDRLKGNPLVMLMVNGDSPAMSQAAAAYAGQFKLPKPWLADQGEGDAQPLAQALDIIATPAALVFDPQGKLVHAQETHVDLKKLEEAIGAAF